MARSSLAQHNLDSVLTQILRGRDTRFSSSLSRQALEEQVFKEMWFQGLLPPESASHGWIRKYIHENLDKALEQVGMQKPIRSPRRVSSSMTSREIVAYLSRRIEQPKAAVRRLLAEQARLAAREASRGFTIPGIGTLLVARGKAKSARIAGQVKFANTRPRKTLRFRFSKSFVDSIN